MLKVYCANDIGLFTDFVKIPTYERRQELEGKSYKKRRQRKLKVILLEKERSTNEEKTERFEPEKLENK